jgi:hypothetical protein
VERDVGEGAEGTATKVRRENLVSPPPPERWGKPRTDTVGSRFDGFLEQIGAECSDTSISSSNPGANGAATASLRVPIDHGVQVRHQEKPLAPSALGASRGSHSRGRRRRQETEGFRYHVVEPQQVNHFTTTSHASEP